MTKVLIVDDAAFIRAQLKQLLMSNGFEVIGEAENGLVALEKIKELKPDLVTLDITMPEMNGIQCMAEISKLEHKPTVIMVSAMGQEAFVRQAIKPAVPLKNWVPQWRRSPGVRTKRLLRQKSQGLPSTKLKRLPLWPKRMPRSPWKG